MNANDITVAKIIAENFSVNTLRCILRDIAGDKDISDDAFDIFARALSEGMMDSES